jgi:mycothiol synthase
MAPGEERAVHQVIEEAFQDHWSARRTSFEEWMHHQTEGRVGSDPALWFLALEEEQIVGAALNRFTTAEDPECGWVAELGVRPPWRRRGIARALLLHAFGALHHRGLHRVGLMVDAENLTGATRLYERVGMVVDRRVDFHEKELRPATPAA